MNNFFYYGLGEIPILCQLVTVFKPHVNSTPLVYNTFDLTGIRIFSPFFLLCPSPLERCFFTILQLLPCSFQSMINIIALKFLSIIQTFSVLRQQKSVKNRQHLSTSSSSNTYCSSNFTATFPPYLKGISQVKINKMHQNCRNQERILFTMMPTIKHKLNSCGNY